MSNPDGHPETLVARHPRNVSRFVHGYYSKRRELCPEATEIADDLMTLSHVTSADRMAAEEIGRLVVLIDRMDVALAGGPLETQRGRSAKTPRKLIEFRFRATKELHRWLTDFGLTPKAGRLGRDALVGAKVRRRVARAEREPAVSDTLADPRAFLAAVVNSADPAISIRERLDALKLLHEIGGAPHPACTCWAPEVAAMSDAELDELTDLQLHNVIMAIDGQPPYSDVEDAADFGDPAKRFPAAVTALRAHVENEVKRLADEQRSLPGVAVA